MQFLFRFFCKIKLETFILVRYDEREDLCKRNMIYK